MRRFVLSVIALVAFGAGVSEAPAFVKITKQQVANVCGSGLQTSNGHSGCTKACGVKKDQQCFYDCSEKTGDCHGVVLPSTRGAVGAVMGPSGKVVERGR